MSGAVAARLVRVGGAIAARLVRVDGAVATRPVRVGGAVAAHLARVRGAVATRLVRVGGALTARISTSGAAVGTTAVRAAAVSMLVAGAASLASPSTRADDVAPPTRAAEVAPGVWVLPGLPGDVEPSNLGRVGNAGFIVGPTGVLVVDTGTSRQHGADLLAAIRAVTDKPVRVALVTHTRQEFLFGATAFQDRHIPVRMHRSAAALMQSRCDRCLKTLRQVLGDAPMQGTAMWKPDEVFDASHVIDAIGRPVRVLAFGHSSGPGDVAVLDPTTGTLFAGGLVDRLRIPDVQDADLDGWSAALAALQSLKVRVLVPGHGPPGSTADIGTVERYLAQLKVRVRALLDSGAALSDVPDAASLPDFAAWDQYETVHRRNASVLFVRFEREQMWKHADPKE